MQSMGIPSVEPEGTETIVFGEMAQSRSHSLMLGLSYQSFVGLNKSSEAFTELAGVFLSAVFSGRHGLSQAWASSGAL